ncbi:MAG: peptide chain release factor N(5)-glutamine methyltransferase [Solirubrobacterales bacterium]|nr:peptide chain release factor N(5)-glutamine methyltransferase [Solirubrobacterales bacterium]
MPRSPDHIIGRTTVRDALDSAVVALTAAGVQSPRLDAELLLGAATGLSRGQIVTDPRRALEPQEARSFADLARRRREREPVAYILGFKGFRTIELKVDTRVLIPRPETELVVEAALELARGARVVDVGTGSGAIALALKAERPDLQITGTDVSPGALAVARANALLLGLEVELLEGDLLVPLGAPVDAVLANPPYVAEHERRQLAPEITRYEPDGALFAGHDGLAVYRRLAPAARSAGATFVAVEVGQGQAERVAGLLREAGYASTAVDPDLAGIERVVRAW